MGLNKVTGHKKIIENLNRAIANEKLAHGYIFDGIEGVGKKLVAFELAKSVLCTDFNEFSCEKCPSCVQMNTKNHPDYMFIEPDGATIKDEQLELFQEFIMLRPFESDKKVIVVDFAEKMTTRAQNRILKIIEEPPKYAMIIFVTENINNILTTIRSRCQKLYFNRLKYEEIKKILLEKNVKNEEMINTAVKFSDGSVKKALELFSSEEFVNMREIVITIVNDIHEGGIVKPSLGLGFIESDKQSAINFLDLMIIWYRDLLMLKLYESSEHILNIDKSAQLKIRAVDIELEKIPKYISIIENAKKEISQYSNLGLVLDAMILKLQEEI